MKEGKVKSKFERVLGTWDVLVIAFGAMIGWGWVVSSGSWIEGGGAIGAALGFLVGGIMVFFVGRTYAELISAMPQCGGEHVYSLKAMGPAASFVCTWAIILGYASVVCFESCTLPMIVTYVWPDFQVYYMYTIAGYDIYASQVLLAAIVATFITYINIRGTKVAAIVQTIFTAILAIIGILIIAGAAFSGDVANLEAQAFIGDDWGTAFNGILTVAMLSPFFFIGFDVIPQAAEEIKAPLKKVGTIVLISVAMATLFYALIIVGIGLILTPAEIEASMAGTGLVTADALAKAFSSEAMSKVVLLGGLCGILTSWNAFMIGGSRAIFAMAESYMIPKAFTKLHEKYRTPVLAILLIGFLSVLAPLVGRKMLVWIVDAGNFGCCLAYMMVAISFLILRKKEPDMPRPYKVSHYKLVGWIAMLMSGFMVVMYIIPGTGGSLCLEEWAMVGGWALLGVIFAVMCKKQYGEKFGQLAHVEYENSESPEDEEAHA